MSLHLKITREWPLRSLLSASALELRVNGKAIFLSHNVASAVLSLLKLVD
jgi:hypothetical protein